MHNNFLFCSQHKMWKRRRREEKKSESGPGLLICFGLMNFHSQNEHIHCVYCRHKHTLERSIVNCARYRLELLFHVKLFDIRQTINVHTKCQ